MPISSLYFIRDTTGVEASGSPNVDAFATQPYDPAYAQRYAALDRRIGLKADLNWDEARIFNGVISKADFWGEVPLPGHRLVRAEFKAGAEAQRIDLLYLRSDGCLVPCELKIAGNAVDSHGQLLRYTADLHYNPWTLRRVVDQRGLYENGHFVASFGPDIWEWMHVNDLDDLSATAPVVRGGILIDEEFPSSLRTTVRYLNDTTDLSIRLVEARAHTEAAWTPESPELWMRLDFVDVEP